MLAKIGFSLFRTGPGAALDNMFARVIVAYLQTLGAHLGFWGVFLG